MQTGSFAADDLKLLIFLLHLPSAEVTGVHHRAQFSAHEFDICGWVQLQLSRCLSGGDFLKPSPFEFIKQDSAVSRN